MRKVEVRRLTARQQRFTEEYLLDCCGAKAAVRAGYSARTADRIASRLLLHPTIAAGLAKHAAQVSSQLGLTVKRLEEELARVAFLDPKGAYDENGHLLPVAEMPEDVRRAISGFEEEALFDTVVVGEGPRGGQQKERVQVGVVRKVKWAGKVEALALALKRLGALVERSEVRVVDETATITNEEWEELAILNHKIRDTPAGGAMPTSAQAERNVKPGRTS